MALKINSQYKCDACNTVLGSSNSDRAPQDVDLQSLYAEHVKTCSAGVRLTDNDMSHLGYAVASYPALYALLQWLTEHNLDLLSLHNEHHEYTPAAVVRRLLLDADERRKAHN